MNKNISASLVVLVSASMLAGCDKETRRGTLVLSGSSVLRLVDESGQTVEFSAGPTKVEFSAKPGKRVNVTISQGADRQAHFSGPAPQGGDPWNFALGGKEIGQPVDINSSRSLEKYGKIWQSVGDGGPCGSNGRWVVEETYQECREDWTVAFTNADDSRSVGLFHSHLEPLSCLLSYRNLFCRENSQPSIPIPIPMPRLPRTANEVHFD